MEKLYLADQDGTNALHLHGSSVSPPVVGARRKERPDALPGGLVEEAIDLALHGTGIQALVQDLDEKIALSQARIHDAYLFLLSASGVSALSARVIAGQVELLDGGLNDRKRGVQTLRLRLIRADCWEENTCALSLSNQNGTDIWDGLAIRNHCDATSGHQNFVDASPAEVKGTLPCPVQVRLILPQEFPAALQDGYFAAGFDLKDAGGAFEHALEGEAGSPGSGCTGSSQPVDSSCSAGCSALVEWTSQSEVALWKWQLSAAQLKYMRARLFRPLLRLAALPAAGIYLRWSVANPGGGELLRTTQTPLDPNRCLAPLPALRLPPDEMGGGAYQPLELHLLAECAAAGTKSLNIDFVHLLPASSFQHLRPLSGLAAGHTLVSDGRENKVYAMHTISRSQHISHLLTGEPVTLQPGRENRIYFLFETAAGAPVDALAQVMIYQKARIRQP